MHLGVWILQLQDGVKDGVGVSFGSDVLQRLQHTHHLGKYQIDFKHNTKMTACHCNSFTYTH